ncbi:TolC family protein [Massilia sp. W12]|uniref:TolC family protein n=1 Tax=Massilia sp. W12 TaxID=3126507 RepID=UPI0030D20852
MNCTITSAPRMICACLAFTFLPLAQAQELRLAEALRLALQQNGDVLLQIQQVESAQGQLEQAKGAFDLSLSASARQERAVNVSAQNGANGKPLQTRNQSANLQAGFKKQLKNGMSLDYGISASAQQNTDTAGITGLQQNKTTVSFNFNIPLWRGRHENGDALRLQSAERAAQASLHTMRQQTSQVLQNVMAAYWDYLARNQQLTLAQGSVQRARQLLDSTQKLVDANEKPRGDLVLLQADLADKQNNLLQAELALQESSRNLARLLGKDSESVLGAPLERFPQPQEQLDNILEQGARLQQLALAQRPDVRAAQEQLEQARLNVKQADEARKPKLDLNLGVSMARASEGGSRLGFPFAAGNTQSEPTVFARLSYEFAPENHAASGAARVNAATLAQSEVRLRDLRNQAMSAFNSALQKTKVTARQLQAARRSLELYELAVRQEITKQRNGIATLIDVITIEGRYNGAQAALINLQADFAKALGSLLHESACLLPPQDAGRAYEIDPVALYSLQNIQRLLAQSAPNMTP